MAPERGIKRGKYVHDIQKYLAKKSEKNVVMLKSIKRCNQLSSNVTQFEEVELP